MKLSCLILLAAVTLNWQPATAVTQQRITHGPILGRLSDRGVGIWARTERPGSFRISYSADPNGPFEQAEAVKTALAHDNCNWFHLRGLRPNTTYYYRVAAGENPPSRSGWFRTLPQSADLRDPDLNPRGLFNFSFEFACGNNQNPDQGSGYDTPAFKTMLERLRGKVHFSIQNGDWLYEDMRTYAADQWIKQAAAPGTALPDVVRHAPTITGVWENYKIYLDRSENLSNYHRYVPTFFTFDDHEILNDVWGAGTPGLRDRRAVFRDIGVRAWYDYLGWSNPLSFDQKIRFGEAQLSAGGSELVDPKAQFRSLDLQQAGTLHVHWGGETAGVNDNALDDVGGDPNAGVYEIVEVVDDHRLRIRPPAKVDGKATYSIGRRSYYRFRVSNCDFFCLDTRTHREMHDTKQPDKAGLSMLGQQQKKWLLDGLRASDADFLFVVSSVNFMVPHVGGGKVRTTNKDDAWTVFLDEREQLIQAMDRIGKPVFMLTGDLHNSFVIKITDRVWEFASGPHNSNNHWYTDEGNRPPNGPFKYGPRECDIRWSTFFRNDIPRLHLEHPTYCVVQVNNVFNNPLKREETRWVAFPRPQVVFQYYDGRTGDLRYAEAVSSR